MAYISFDKSELVNLEYSLGREILLSNRAGAFACTTIIGCNTRKYHGLLVCPVQRFGGERHVLLSSLDVSVLHRDKSFNMGIHKYLGEHYDPKGHQYVRDYEVDTIPGVCYRLGEMVLLREMLMVEHRDQVLIRFSLLEGNEKITLRMRPFLAFRNMHSLTRANLYASTKTETVANGVKIRMYDDFPWLHLQLSVKNEFMTIPDWFYNIEYSQEKERGYDCHEDLFVPGYLECTVSPGESLVFSAGTGEEDPKGLKRLFSREERRSTGPASYRNCLANAARQFVVKREGRTEVIAGFPWFGSWGRDTFIALPGLTLSLDDPQTCKEVMDTMLGKLKDGLFPNMGNDAEVAYNSVDAPLWFFWCLQQYVEHTGIKAGIWKEYGPAMKTILNAFRYGTIFNIRMTARGLIYAGAEGKALTWMDAVVQGVPVTQRKGIPVEINALWYNAVMFSLEMAKIAGDRVFLEEWKDLPGTIAEAFVKTFWSKSKGYLADVVDHETGDWCTRPNQVIALSMPYSPLGVDMKRSILSVVEQELLTPKGLRTLSPKCRDYRGVYEGDQDRRDRTYHQGTVWPWLLEHFCRAYLDVYKQSGLPLVRKIYDNFEEDMASYGIGTIPEIYDGDPPHTPRGAISQAWSVAALLRIGRMIEKQDVYKQPGL